MILSGRDSMELSSLAPIAHTGGVALIGRYSLIDEISTGHFRRLHVAHSQRDDTREQTGAALKLVHVVSLPANLPEEDYRRISHAIWDSTDCVYGWALDVVDVVSCEDSVALIHDFVEGALLQSVSQRCRDLGRPFSTDMMVRVALDIAEGYGQSRDLCEASQVPFHHGGITLDSLYLCSDGRTRTLDSQVVAATVGSPSIRALARKSLTLAPEMVNNSREPDERVDVFTLGSVLAELLCCPELTKDPSPPVGSTVQIVPYGSGMPEGVMAALRQALSVDPLKRQPALQEFVLELVLGTATIATHSQVAGFANALSGGDTCQRGDFVQRWDAGGKPLCLTGEKSTLSALVGTTSIVSVVAGRAPDATAVDASQLGPTRPTGGRFLSPFDPGLPPLKTKSHQLR